MFNLKCYFKPFCYKYVPTFCVFVSSAHTTGALFTVSAPGPLNILRPPLLLDCKRLNAETRSAARSPTLRVAPCCLHMFVTEYATVWQGDAAAFSFTLHVFLSSCLSASLLLCTYWLGFHSPRWGIQPKAVETGRTGRSKRSSSR